MVGDNDEELPNSPLSTGDDRRNDPDVVIFLFGNTRLTARQAILAQRSPVFKELFSNTDGNSSIREYEVTETSAETFRLFLASFNGRIIDFSKLQVDDVLDILQLATKYQMKQLEESTADYLKSIINNDNVWNIFNKAVQCKQLDLIGQCWVKVKPDSSGTDTANENGTSTAPPLPRVALADNNGVNHRPVLNFHSNVLVHPNAEIITFGNPMFFEIPKEFTLFHSVEDTEGIKIKLDQLYVLNYLEMELAKGDCSYWVAVSENNITWTRIIDYSDFICRSVQRLYFKTCTARYIRIFGNSPVDEVFEISRLEAYYKRKKIEVDRSLGIVIPTSNVALEEKNAVVIQGENWNGGMLNGNFSDGWTEKEIGEDSIIVQLPQPYMLDSINLKLGRSLYNYNVETSIDKVNWTRVFSEEKVRGRRHAEFDKQPVVFIKLTGTCGTYDDLYCKHLECPAITKI